MRAKVLKEKRLQLQGVEILVQEKSVKNLSLRITTEGEAVASVPRGLPSSYVQDFLKSKLDWIREHQGKVQRRRENSPEVQGFDGKKIWLFGHPVRVDFVYGEKISLEPKVSIDTDGEKLTFCCTRPYEGAVTAHKQKLLQAFCRLQLELVVQKLAEKWQPKLGLYARSWRFRSMKSRWGSCNVRTGDITINTRLAYRPAECLEYVVVHELAHLYEPSHGPRFHLFLDAVLPDWKKRRELLNNFSFCEHSAKKCK